MRKVLVNCWVDIVTGVAFIILAATGVVFLFPGSLHTAVGTTPTIFLIPAMGWHSVHDWAGVAMVAGTAPHLALHAKWITAMTRRTFGAQSKAASSRAAQPAPVSDDDAAASLRRLDALRNERRHEHEQRTSRRRFLAGAAVVGDAALLAGAGLVGREAVSGAGTRVREDGWTDGGEGQADSGTSGGGSASQDSAAGGSGSANGAQGSASGSTASLVTVDESACVACGRCLQVCPASAITINA